MRKRSRPARAAMLAALAALALGSAWWWGRGDRDPDAVFRRVRAALAAKDVAAAEAAVGRLARLRPPDEFDRLLRAQVAEAAGRPDAALAELARIGDRHPLAPLARMLAGHVEKKRNRLRPAEAAYRAAAALEPKSDKPLRELVYIYNLQHRQRDLDAQLAALSERGGLEYDYLVHWAKTRNVVWNPERDVETLARCVRADPDDRRSRLALAEGLLRLNRPDEARETLDPLPEADPPARALRAAIALDRGDEAGYKRIDAGAPADDPDLAPIRGRYALKEGDPAAAARFFWVAYAADPADRSAAFGLGNALKQMGDAAAAAPYLEAVRRADLLTPLVAEAASSAGRKDPTLPARIGAACEAAGRPVEASAWFRLAIGRNPLDETAQAALARLARRVAATPGPDAGR